MLELAARKGKRQANGVAVVKTQSQHLAVLELYIVQQRLVKLGQAQITGIKSTINKAVLGKILLTQVTSSKKTIFIFSPFEPLARLKSLIL